MRQKFVVCRQHSSFHRTTQDCFEAVLVTQSTEAGKSQRKNTIRQATVNLRNLIWHRRHIVLAVAIIAAVGVASSFSVYLMAKQERAEAILETHERAETISAELEKGFQQVLLVARGVAAALARDTRVDETLYADIVARVAPNSDDAVVEFLNIAFSRDLIVQQVYPRAANAEVLGLDYRDYPDQLSHVRQALDNADAVMIAPVDLVQGAKGAIARMRVEDVRTEEITGVVSVVATLDSLFTKANDIAERDGLNLQVIKTGPTSEPMIVFGDAPRTNAEPVVIDFDVLDETWQMRLVPQEGWAIAPADAAFVFIFFGALGGSVFLLFVYIDRTESIRRSAEENLHTAIDAINDGFALYDKDDRLVLCNDTYKSFYPRSADAIVPGATFAEILEKGLRNGEYRDAYGREGEYTAERMAAHTGSNSTFVEELDDGRWLKISERKLSDGSRVGFRVDITELMEARRAAEAGSRAKSAFLDRMSHELRTPLSVLMGYAAFLSKPERLAGRRALKDHAPDAELAAYDAEITSHAEHITRSSRQLLSLIDRVLQVSRAEQESFEAGGQVSLDLILDDLVRAFEVRAGDRCTLELHKAGSIATVDHGDTVRKALSEILRHCVDGFLSAHVEMSVAAQPDTIKIAVEIAGERNAQTPDETIVEPFPKQKNPSSHRDMMSLELAIAERLVLRLGGRFEYRRDSAARDLVDVTLPKPKDREVENAA
jgi:sensor domain CHASE-containing protein